MVSLSALNLVAIVIGVFCLHFSEAVLSKLSLPNVLLVTAVPSVLYFTALGVWGGLLYRCLPLYFGLTAIAENLVLDLLLAEVIDYDMLVTGTRRSGLFAVYSVAVAQLCEILALLPSIMFVQMRYVNNGGCRCGCGVACLLPFVRWDCDGDVGYSCSTGLTSSNPPFFGDPHRPPPCTRQTFTSASVSINFCMCFVPAVLWACVATMSMYPPILPDDSLMIRYQLKQRTQGLPAFDPIQMQPIRSEKQLQNRIMPQLLSWEECNRKLTPYSWYSS